ncbi:MAG: septation protein SepH [Bowdeniella nasicola]|nr:septation protein SepH [Bowdeniella nasicola]
MTTLTFVSLRSDGTQLVLRDEEGHTYQLPITAELRQAVRRPRPVSPTAKPTTPPALRPRDIQSMLRAGLTVAEVADRGGVEEDYVRRYEGPIIAERNWAITQARECAVGHEVGAPTLGDLVVDRLADRGVRTEDLEWNAFRDEGGPWHVTVRFTAGGKDREARWKLDLQTSTVRAVEEDARWLSETDTSTPRGRRHARTFSDSLLGDGEETLTRGGESESAQGRDSDEKTPTESLLEQLARRRGRRHELEDTGLFDEEPVGEVPPAHPSRPEDAEDAVVLPFPGREEDISTPGDGELDIPVPKVDPEPRKPKKKSGRRSVPSWDEIVFGGRSED